MFRDKRGYTLVELIVVIVLIGLVLTLAVPRLRNALLTDNLKGTARKMIGIISNLRNEAIREQRDYLLHFDLGANRFWVSYGSMTDEERTVAREKGSNLPVDIHIDDVWIKGEGKMVEGVIRIRFTRRGYTQKSAIHLSSEGGRKLTLVLSPFLGKVKVINKYVGFD
ncbi:MAG: type II secretion system GspH family protein [Desulfobacteraceae bacterium]|nr:type II secretion system GspH family protein [Desulfobacteraceae bacterium]